MNETMEVLLRRRSTKRYLQNQITDESIALMIEAATFAPSSMNSQPWHFAVIQNKSIIDEISQKTIDVMISLGMDEIREKSSRGGFHILHNAPTVIIISGKSDYNYSKIDCAIAASNILISAESLGLGACFIGSIELFFSTKDGKSFLEGLGIPHNYNGLYAISLGYKTDYRHPQSPRAKNICVIVK